MYNVIDKLCSDNRLTFAEHDKLVDLVDMLIIRAAEHENYAPLTLLANELRAAFHGASLNIPANVCPTCGGHYETISASL